MLDLCVSVFPHFKIDVSLCREVSVCLHVYVCVCDNPKSSALIKGVSAESEGTGGCFAGVWEPRAGADWLCWAVAPPNQTRSHWHNPPACGPWDSDDPRAFCLALY